MKIEVMAKKSGSYGKKVDKLRKKSRQKYRSYGKKADKNIKVTAKKSGSYGKKVRFKNLNYSEKATKTLNCVHKIKNI